MQRERYTILFADIAGSSALYERLGDLSAKSLVVDLQKRVADVIARGEGRVHEIVGDEILAVFASTDRAVACAGRIHAEAATRGRPNGEPLGMRIGLNDGEVIEESGRLFGESVNLAARMVAMARTGQTLLTETVYVRLSSPLREETRAFDRARVRGFAASTAIFDLPWRKEGLTERFQAVGRADRRDGERCLLRLEHRGSTVEIADDEAEATIGRASDGLLVVDADPVSRHHARIESLRGRYVLHDTSTNGTLVCIGDDSIWLRRDGMPLFASGTLCLGGPPMASGANVVRFRLETATRTGGSVGPGR